MTKKLASRRSFTPTENYLKIQEIWSSEKYKLTLNEIQELIAKRKSNGLDAAVRQIGTRYFIREDLFDRWYDDNRRS